LEQAVSKANWLWPYYYRKVSASKVRWPELSQLSLCSEFDKENSMEFSLISLLLIHFTTMAMRLLSHGPHVTLVMWHAVTVTICHTIVTSWQSHMILSRAPSCSCKSNKKRKKKKRKRNINNDLAVLPSHDRREQSDLTYNITKDKTTCCYIGHCIKGAKWPNKQHYSLSHRLL